MQRRYSTDKCRPEKETPLTNIIIARAIKCLIKQRTFQIKHGILTADLKQYDAMERLQLQLDYLKGKNTKAFCHMVIHFENEITLLLPGQNTRFTQMRAHLLNIISKSKQIINP